MPRTNYPFPALGTLHWRTRHTFTGDTTPPSRAGGVPSLSTRVPFLETGTSGDGGGLHVATTRAIGMGEDPRSSVFNRPLYDLACSLDILMEKDSAELEILTSAAVVSGGAPDYLVDVVACFVPDPVIYLGPAGTTAVGGADPEKWCSNYIKVWGPGATGPAIDPITGQPFQVMDVRNMLTGLVSVYANHPTNTQVYPFGTPGVMTSVVGTAVQFYTLAGGDAPPVGTAASPNYQAFFNYTLFERNLATNPTLTTPYATCASWAGALPATYTMDRDVQALGWLAGDVVYLSHFMYAPQISMSGNYAPGVETALLHGTPALAAFGASYRFMDLLRFSDTTILPMPLEVTEPPAATMGSFDYANALIRAVDGAMTGTIGFDFRGGSDRDIPGGGTDTDDAYAGFMHRKLMSFGSPLNTELATDDGVSWAGSTVTLTGFPVSHFYGAAPANSHVLLGVDMIELTTAAGVTIGLYVIDGVGGVGATCNIANLDGSVPVLGADNGTMRVYRPQFRTGIWDSAGVLAGRFGGTLFVGDEFDTDIYAAVGALSVGASDIFTGWNSPLPRDLNVAMDASVVPRFRVLYTGGLQLAGAYDGASQMYTEVSGGPLAAPTWNGAGTSWTTDLGTSLTGAAKPWNGRHLYLHSLDANGGDDSVYTQLSVTAGPVAGLGGAEHAGVWMGFPGVAYPLGATVGAGDRNAGFVFSRNTGAFMELSAGITTAAPALLRRYTLRQTPTNRNPPATFASPARLEMDTSTSIGWEVEKTFYQNIVISEGQSCAVGNWTYGQDAGGFAVWFRAGAGDATELNDSIDFPFNIPAGATITAVDVKYGHSNGYVGGGGSRLPLVYVRREDPNMAVSAGVPSARVELLAAGSWPGIGVGGAGWHWQVIPYVPDQNALVDNSLYQYSVRVACLYDAGAGVAAHEIAGIRITYTCVDLLPA